MRSELKQLSEDRLINMLATALGPNAGALLRDSDVVEVILRELQNISIRQRELAEQAASGTYSLKQRRAL